MVDQNIPKDWDAYFRALGPREPYVGPGKTPIFIANPAPSIVFVKGEALESLSFSLTEWNLFNEAKDVWEANGGPEMWLFYSAGDPPWHVPPRPAPVKKKGR